MFDELLQPPKLSHALAYARRGWRVLPLNSVRGGDCSCGRDGCSSVGKHPRTKNGVMDATTDEATIRAWWDWWPDANIGIATGNGLLVGDFDLAKGANLEALQAFGYDQLLDTMRVETGSKGVHLYWATTAKLGNTAGKIGPFIDTRGEGGYVVAPPSHNKYGPYTWVNNRWPIRPLTPELLAFLSGSRVDDPKSSQFFSNMQLNQKEIKNEISSISQTHSEQTSREADSTNSVDSSQTNSAGMGMQAAVAGTDATPVHPIVLTGAAALPAAALADVRSEARNNFLTSMAGTLRNRGLTVVEILQVLLTINQERYGNGRHPQGPLELHEIESTVFKSVRKWEKEQGGQEAKVPHLGRLDDLMKAKLPPLVWTVPGLLSEGLTLLAGKPKLGKSLLVLDLVLNCALGSDQGGRPVLGRFPVQADPLGVFYLALEDGPRRLQDRVNKLLAGRSVPFNFGYAFEWKPLEAGGLEDLKTLLTVDQPPQLVVIDTLAKLRRASGKSGNMYQEDYDLIGSLQRLALEFHINLLVVHHKRKAPSEDTFDSFSGSTGLMGAADTGWSLDRARNQHEATLALTGRDIEEQELALTMDKETCLWSCTGNVADRQQSQARQEILALLEGHEAMTPAEIAKELEKERSTVRMHLSRMAKEGVLLKNGRGSYALRVDQSEK